MKAKDSYSFKLWIHIRRTQRFINVSCYFISELLHLYTGQNSKERIPSANLDLSKFQVQHLHLAATGQQDQLANLRNLLVLDCKRNHLIDIPAVVYSLTSLTTLYLRFNRIQELEAKLGNLTNLTN